MVVSNLFLFKRFSSRTELNSIITTMQLVLGEWILGWTWQGQKRDTRRSAETSGRNPTRATETSLVVRTFPKLSRSIVVPGTDESPGLAR